MQNYTAISRRRMPAAVLIIKHLTGGGSFPQRQTGQACQGLVLAAPPLYAHATAAGMKVQVGRTGSGPGGEYVHAYAVIPAYVR